MNIYIIIPVFNEENYLNDCINSIVNQSFTPKKLLLVNDNSTDDSETIIKKYSQSISWIEYLNTASD